MIKIDSSQFEKEIAEIVAKLTDQIERGVENFTVYTATLLIRTTPYGNVEKYFWLYEKRQEQFGFEMLPGLAKGSWVVSMNSAPNLGALAYDSRNGYQSGSRAIINAQEYEIGDDIYVSNSVPYIGNLEQGSSKQLPDGFTPVFEGVYSTNLNKFFKIKKTNTGNFE
jgi:hypothetical protein